MIANTSDAMKFKTVNIFAYRIWKDNKNTLYINVK